MNEIVGSARAVRLVWVDPPFQPVKAVSETPPAELSNSKTDRRLSTNKLLHKSVGGFFPFRSTSSSIDGVLCRRHIDITVSPSHSSPSHSTGRFDFDVPETLLIVDIVDHDPETPKD